MIDCDENFRTSKRLTDADWWYGMSKTIGFRWHMNKIENLLLSIYAEHPDRGDPYRKIELDGKGLDIYTRIWRVLRKCEADLTMIKKIHKPPLPKSAPEDTKDSGCYCDADCGPGWHCNRETWLCEPGDPNEPPPPRYQDW